MIWEFKSSSIVQLCNTVENGMEKCHMYWPSNEGERIGYGSIDVTLQSQVTHNEFTVRKFQLKVH